MAAPADVKLNGLNVMLAMPAASVSAVPPTGFMLARVASVVNITTVLGTAAPAAFFRVALTVAGAAVEMEVVVAPAAVVSAIVSVGAVTAAVVVAPTPEAVANVFVTGTPEAAPAAAPPPPQPVSIATEAANNNGNVNLAILLLEKIFST